MNAMFPRLFERGKIGQLEIENRIVKDPTVISLGNPDGSVTDRMIRFYEEQTRGGAGLVVVNTGSLAHIPTLTFMSKLVHDNGAKVALQLVSKNASVNEVSVEEIRKIVAAVGDLARLAKMTDFDMVYLHACHGDLPASFLSPLRNHRADSELGHQYGGSLHHRMKFLVDIVKDIKLKTGRDFPLAVKMSPIDYEPGGLTLDESLEVIKVLEGLGVDAIDVSAGIHGDEAHGCPSSLIPVGQNVPAAAAIKKAVSIPVIVVGAITTPQFAEEILESGKADFIALARPLLSDPCWPRKAKEGRPEDIKPCIRCNYGCNDMGPPSHTIRCTVNPALGWEDRLPFTPAERVKNVAVIGGGPAGLEAAMDCALRGHKVTLYEKRKMGGAMIEASIPDFKADIRPLITYYVNQMKELKVKVVNKEATAQTIRDGKFDAAVVAVGAAMRKPDVPGINKPIATDVLAVLNGKKVGKRVHIVGGGIIGVEVSIWLAEQEKEVTISTRQGEIMTGVVEKNRVAYEERLAGLKKFTVLTGRSLASVSDKGATVVDNAGNRKQVPSDTIVLSAGFLPQTGLRDQLDKIKGLDVYTAGDCISPRLIYDAIHEGFIAARKV